MESACAVLYCRLSHVFLYPIFPHYLFNYDFRTKEVIQQYLLQQMHNLILFSVNLAYMFRLIRPSRGQQSLGIPRIQ